MLPMMMEKSMENFVYIDKGVKSKGSHAFLILILIGIWYCIYTIHIRFDILYILYILDFDTNT